MGNNDNGHRVTILLLTLGSRTVDTELICTAGFFAKIVKQ